MQDIEVQGAAVAARLEAVRERLRRAAEQAGRRPEDVALAAVSKYHSAGAIAAAIAAGQRVFAENYVQEALAKQEELKEHEIFWHFIGKLQSNKAKFAVGRFSLVHTVDSLKLARTLHKKALDIGEPQAVLLQVNVGREEQKAGVLPEDLASLAREAAHMEGLQLQGLMCMPPWHEDPERSRPYFRMLCELRNTLQDKERVKLPELSMGMSGDCEVAVAEGATLVRVGTDIFGPRPVKTQG